MCYTVAFVLYFVQMPEKFECGFHTQVRIISLVRVIHSHPNPNPNKSMTHGSSYCNILTLDPAQKCYSKVMHRKEVTHSNGQ